MAYYLILPLLERESKEAKVNQTMIRRFFLLLLMGVPLVAAAVTGTSLPVLLVMGGLLLFGLTVASRSEQQ